MVKEDYVRIWVWGQPPHSSSWLPPLVLFPPDISVVMRIALIKMVVTIATWSSINFMKWQNHHETQTRKQEILSKKTVFRKPSLKASSSLKKPAQSLIYLVRRWNVYIVRHLNRHCNALDELPVSLEFYVWCIHRSFDVWSMQKSALPSQDGEEITTHSLLYSWLLTRSQTLTRCRGGFKRCPTVQLFPPFSVLSQTQVSKKSKAKTTIADFSLPSALGG